MDWVKNEAIERNKKYIRIEFYTDRDYLVKFYENNGFKLVKPLVMPDGTGISLYEYALKL